MIILETNCMVFGNVCLPPSRQCVREWPDPHHPMKYDHHLLSQTEKSHVVRTVGLYCPALSERNKVVRSLIQQNEQSAPTRAIVTLEPNALLSKGRDWGCVVLFSNKEPAWKPYQECYALCLLFCWGETANLGCFCIPLLRDPYLLQRVYTALRLCWRP